ncbi:MAG: hypothetical protein V4805_00360 [Pseudomonadota bacterium]
MFLNLSDTTYFLVLIASAIAGVWYFLSASRRARKQSQWRKAGGMTAIAEWGEWLLGLAIAVVFIAAAIGMSSKYLLQ